MYFFLPIIRPNSYRIFSEDINDDSLPADAKYSNQAPPIYTQPLIVPAQAIEDRNRPHGGRAAAFLRENPHNLNEPVNRIGTKNKEDSKWWEWNVPEDDSLLRNKKRATDYRNNSIPNVGATMTPQQQLQQASATGIVPVNDLNSFSREGGPQRVFVEKMSFDHQYDSRKNPNYPNKGKVGHETLS